MVARHDPDCADIFLLCWIVIPIAIFYQIMDDWNSDTQMTEDMLYSMVPLF
jgi:hypothetical protein